jgi:putative molybdopterin biosynthesis protein
MSLVRADGFCVIDQNSEGVEAGESVRVELYRSLADIDRTLVAIGSHDLILDVIGDLMSGNGDAPFFLSSTHVGSLGGLMALKRGECHIAPTHLLDEDTGVYNVAYLRKLFGDVCGSKLEVTTTLSVAKVTGVGRVQGIMVAPGNPLGIKDVAHLVGHRYINRQKGAGTRLFLDYRLLRAGVDPAAITGYEREATTHMAVAIAVQSGSADAGMGISSAAASLGLSFVPLGEEEYDFAIPVRYLELPMVQAFIATLKSAAFHDKLAGLGGYTWDHCGDVVSTAG